ncbi:enoyl-CoA hydratase [Aeromicrobium fastidiosum]|uniref:Enoyl-CoA hydratase n=1 Tax=Aeromicrobium fastidiosum TaxID=52699 RepID=A0A641AT34_9ACTN|nr:enoyl-CoA hydratase [Aeromicrobium fastidiosum]KAA1380403.1 enoyl-CoA hydratase [Aeromicrobium fastidiosum]MBP2389977.1 enoyl-CoA hydratase [Aeromicrobium fastidiosum]
MPLVLLDSDGPVRLLTLNAPERRNALDWPLLDELAAAVRDVAADADARALVVTGAGKGFCAGANLSNLFGDLDRPTDQMREHLMKVYASFLGIRDLAIPTIAAVNGAAIGAGMNVALACDVIVAGPHAGFGPTFAEIGLHPGGGCSWMMTERIGRGRTTAALLSGVVIGADEATRIGLADQQSDDPVDTALGLARLYAGREPKLMADIKQSVRIAAASDLATSLAFESQAQAESMRNERFREFMQRFAD